MPILLSAIYSTPLNVGYAFTSPLREWWHLAFQSAFLAGERIGVELHIHKQIILGIFSLGLLRYSIYTTSMLYEVA